MTPAAATVLFRNVRAPCHSDASLSILAEAAVANARLP